MSCVLTGLFLGCVLEPGKAVESDAAAQIASIGFVMRISTAVSRLFVRVQSFFFYTQAFGQVPQFYPSEVDVLGSLY